MADQAEQHAAATRDLWVAAGMAVTGITLSVELWDYAPKARIFPLSLAITMIVCGAGVALSALRVRSTLEPSPLPEASTPPPPQDDNPAAIRAGLLRGALPLALVLFSWALAVSLGAGYLIPSVPMLIVALWIAGARRRAELFLGGPAIALGVFTLFYIIFRTRLPELEAIRDVVAPLRRLF